MATEVRKMRRMRARAVRVRRSPLPGGGEGAEESLASLIMGAVEDWLELVVVVVARLSEAEAVGEETAASGEGFFGGIVKNSEISPPPLSP